VEVRPNPIRETRPLHVHDDHVALFIDLVGSELDESSLSGGAILSIRPLAEVVGGEFWNVGVRDHRDVMARAVEDCVARGVRPLGMYRVAVRRDRQREELPACAPNLLAQARRFVVLRLGRRNRE